MKNTKNYLKNPLALTLAAALVLIPATTFAKTNKLNANQANGCPTKAFGHLFAPGWLKHNNGATVPLGCLLPSGIAKKLGLQVPPPSTGTTTDTVAPAISSIVATPAVTSATFTWTTNENADSAVYFGTSLPVNTSATATQVVSSSTKVASHQLTLTGLNASTTYFAVIGSRDASGNMTLSSPLSFTTGTNADTTSPVLTNLITVVGTSSLTLTWNTNEPSTSKVFYSTSTPVNTSSTSPSFVENLSLVTNHSITLTGLGTSTPYHIVIQSKDFSGNTSTGIEFPVTTSQ
jgi:hypothetical protein